MRSVTPLALALPLAFAAAPALAHHPLAGAPMETFAQGLLSGAGHPLLGFDHLAFVLIAGVAAGLAGAPTQGALAYVGAMLAGCLLSAFGLALPLAEPMIALSLLVVGGAVALAAAPVPARAVGALMLFGLFHGSAFGQSVAGAEAGAGVAVLLGYLLGLGVVQAAIAAATARLARRAASAAGEAAPIGPRLAGAMAAGVGALLSLELLEGAALAGLG